jgi:hypothetical protein
MSKRSESNSALPVFKYQNYQKVIHNNKELARSVGMTAIWLLPTSTQ